MQSKLTADALLSTLESVAVRYRTQYMADLAEVGVTPSEAAILLLLASWSKEDLPTQADIIANLPGSAPPSRVINDLYDRGLVECTNYPGDRRMWRHQLDPSAKKTVKKIREIRRRYSKKLRESIGASMFEEMFGALDTFNNWLGKRQSSK